MAKNKDMKDNISPGVDGIPPKLLLEIVEQTSIPLATVFKMSLEEGVVLNEKKQTSYRYLKNVRETNQKTIDQSV